MPYFEWFGYGLTVGLMCFGLGFVIAGPAYLLFGIINAK